MRKVASEGKVGKVEQGVKVMKYFLYIVGK